MLPTFPINDTVDDITAFDIFPNFFHGHSWLKYNYAGLDHSEPPRRT